MSILGHRVVRKEDPALLTGSGRYVDAIDVGDALHATFVRSTVAHAKLLSLDVEDARSAPGVVAVLTATDLDLPDAEPPPYVQGAPPEMKTPWLARDRVRHVGEPIAMILTEDRYQGVDAAEHVVADYDELPAVIDPEVAARDEDLLFPEAGSNHVVAVEGEHDEHLFDGCDVVVKGRFVNQRVAPAPLEARVAAARMGDDGRLTFWASTQSTHMLKGALAAFLGVERDRVRVISADVGGGFGAKVGLCREEGLVAWAARHTGRPVRWAETRSESLAGWTHGRAQIHHAEIGGSRDGRILAYRLHVLQDSGAYVHVAAGLPAVTRRVASTVYDIPRVEFTGDSVLTNTAPVGAFRGAGRPEANAAMERAVDLFATELGMDPVEVRRRNLIGKDAFPYQTKLGTEYDTGDYAGALDRACADADYEALRAEQARRREAGGPKQLGIGVATYVEVTAGGPAPEFAKVELTDEGGARVTVGRPPQGQGHGTAWAMIVSDALGIPFEKVDYAYGDTDAMERGGLTGGSSSLQVGGSAVRVAAESLVEKAKRLAGERMEVAVEDVVFDADAGRFHVAGVSDLNVGWEDLRSEAGEEGLGAEGDFKTPKPTFPFGACVAVVEVDTETGGVRVDRIVSVDDAGRLLNPLLAEGQVQGGLAQGVAQALLEEVQYDEWGNPLTTSFADYLFISPTELPDFETRFMETPTPHNPLGAKGVGESGTMGATPAVQSAVVDALSHLGVRHIDMPCGPERVWRAIQRAPHRPGG
jgi:carbon-monoxide dehydrogenase large subunit